MLLHYDCLSEFKSQFYKDLLTVEHQTSGEQKIDVLHYTDSTVEEEANFWGYSFQKNGVKYLVPTSKTKIDELLPIFAKNTEKVASKGTAYQLLTKAVPARPKPIKQITFKELVNSLTSFKHSNPDHQKLWWFMGLTQMMDRANYRVSTPAGFGKDSVVDIFRDLIGGSTTIESPTLAKLEFLSSYKWIAINEVLDISKPEWKIIEQFLLTSGAFKSEIAKHSRATGGMKEMLHINSLSLSLLYNDIDHYTDPNKYFDTIAKEALIDRFPAFRLYGTYTEDFNQVKSLNIKQFVKTNFEEYKKLVSTFAYYKNNLMSELHHYKLPVLDMKERWKTNLNKLLKVVDLYSESQEEFDGWVKIIKESMRDYDDMLKYYDCVDIASKRLSDAKMIKLLKELESVNTFTEKNKLLINSKAVEPVKDTKFWS